MRFLVGGIVAAAIFYFNLVFAEAPPFSSLTISGKVAEDYNKVALFEKGSSKTPLKTGYISKDTGTYQIIIDLSKDFPLKDLYSYIDLRFWDDKNDNGIKEGDESISECHLIVWIPATSKIYFKICDGSNVDIKSPSLIYDYLK